MNEKISFSEMSRSLEKLSKSLEEIDSKRIAYILGTKYEILKKSYGSEDTDGETDFYSKKIFLRDDNVNGITDFLEEQKNVLRHEIIHAFMYESGLGFNWVHDCDYGHDETVIDWFAIQSPKIFKTFKRLDIL